MESKLSQKLKTSVEILRPELVDTTQAIFIKYNFGPLGMVYSTINGAMIMYMLALPLTLITEGFALLAIGPVCIFGAAFESRNIQNKIF